MKRIILASQSPWRAKLLTWIGLDFEVMVSDFDEKSVEENNPKELVKILAEKKAEAVAGNIKSGVIIGADTVIVFGDEVIGKPRDINHAREILLSLRGKTHFVYTGVCVLDAESRKIVVEVDETKMVFKNFSDEDLEIYLKTGDSLGKAGAYQLLEIKDKFVDSFDGSVSGVIGLPIKRVARMLKEVGIEVEGDIEKVMMEKIGYRD